jgi:hypothetical protein
MQERRGRERASRLVAASQGGEKADRCPHCFTAALRRRESPSFPPSLSLSLSLSLSRSLGILLLSILRRRRRRRRRRQACGKRSSGGKGAGGDAGDAAEAACTLRILEYRLETPRRKNTPPPSPSPAPRAVGTSPRRGRRAFDQLRNSAAGLPREVCPGDLEDQES